MPSMARWEEWLANLFVLLVYSQQMSMTLCIAQHNHSKSYAAITVNIN